MENWYKNMFLLAVGLNSLDIFLINFVDRAFKTKG